MGACGDKFQVATDGKFEIQCTCDPPEVIYRIRETIPRLQYVDCSREMCEMGEYVAWAGGPSRMETVQGPCHHLLVGNSIEEVVNMENI